MSNTVKWKIYSHWNNISSNRLQYLVLSFVKTLLWRNFCQKSVRVNFRNFHTHCGRKLEIFIHLKNISSNQLHSKVISKNIVFKKFSQKSVRVNFRNFHTVKCHQIQYFTYLLYNTMSGLQMWSLGTWSISTPPYSSGSHCNL